MLVPDLEALWVMLDKSQTTLYIRVEDRWGNVFSPASLSEGTLRLIAFSALAEDESIKSTISVEEPEKGFHPRQMYQALNVLRSVTDSPSELLRQVLIFTHSPSLVACAPEDALLFASNEPKAGIDKTPNTLRLSCLSNTWRTKIAGQQIAAKGHVISFLGVVPNPAGLSEDDLERLGVLILAPFLGAKNLSSTSFNPPYDGYLRFGKRRHERPLHSKNRSASDRGDVPQSCD